MAATTDDQAQRLLGSRDRAGWRRAWAGFESMDVLPIEEFDFWRSYLLR